MKPVAKQSLLMAIIITLFVINLGLVTFMWYTQRPENGPLGATTANFLIKELNLDKDQSERYLQLQKNLGDSLIFIRTKDRRLHDRFFEMMHIETPDSLQLATLIDSMAEVRGRIEFYTFRHFRQVRALCNTEQQKKFDKIIGETMRRMGPPPGSRRRPEDNGPPPNDAGPPGGR